MSTGPRALLAVTLAIASLLRVDRACAESTPVTPLAPAVAAEPPAPSRRLPWVFPRFRAWEWAGSIATSIGSLAVEFGTDHIPDNHWRRGLFFDDNARDALVARSSEGRARAAKLSDVSWPIVQYFPIVDAIVTPLATDHGNLDTAFQLTLLNWESQSLAFLLTRSTHRLVGRSRPLVGACNDTPSYDILCNPRATGRAASMISGHTSMSFAGAGLTCAHHLAMPLYGARWADIGTCVFMLAGATTTGLLRMMADRHWASDVLLGAGVGLATGWLMPWALHYARWNIRTAGRTTIEGTVMPSAMGTAGVGLTTAGLF